VLERSRSFTFFRVERTAIVAPLRISFACDFVTIFSDVFPRFAWVSAAAAD
jgi:hypothetical protein